MYEIKTGNFIVPKKVLVDGKNWTIIPPGAGDELAMSQAKRRLEFLEKKLKDGTINEEELDTFDRLEQKLVDIFLYKVFKDETKDNSEVREWVKSTPLAVIIAVVDDIKRQVEAKDAKDQEVPTS